MAQIPAKQWRQYIDGMGPKTRKYVELECPEFGRGAFGSVETVKLIYQVSKANDELGAVYAFTIDTTSDEITLSIIEDSEFVKGALRNQDNFRAFLDAINNGSVEDLENYAKSLGLLD